jgi:hypothetical protein
MARVPGLPFHQRCFRCAKCGDPDVTSCGRLLMLYQFPYCPGCFEAAVRFFPRCLTSVDLAIGIRTTFSFLPRSKIRGSRRAMLEVHVLPRGCPAGVRVRPRRAARVPPLLFGRNKAGLRRL